MIKIMFVCHGNICRSPMAEMIFKNMVEKKGISKKFEISSSAVSSEEIYGDKGNPIYPPAKAVLRAHNIPFSEHYATLLKCSDYDNYNFFIAMDESNVSRMVRIFGCDCANKIRKLMDFTFKGGNVSDPWYTGDFEKAFKDIEFGCEKLLEYIIKNFEL